MMEMKFCTKCGVNKELTSYYPDRSKKAGLRPRCKLCDREDVKISHSKHKEKIELKRKEYRASEHGKRVEKLHARKYKLEKAYGMTLEQFNKMIEAQNGCCKICGDILLAGKRTHVDHNHTTNKVRAILCYLCNVGLGAFRDKSELLDKAARYVRSFEVHETYTQPELMKDQRKPLDAYTDQEIQALYKETEDEDKAMAEAGLQMWADRLNREDSTPLVDDIPEAITPYDPKFGDRKVCTCGLYYIQHYVNDKPINCFKFYQFDPVKELGEEFCFPEGFEKQPVSKIKLKKKKNNRKSP